MPQWQRPLWPQKGQLKVAWYSSVHSVLIQYFNKSLSWKAAVNSLSDVSYTALPVKSWQTFANTGHHKRSVTPDQARLEQQNPWARSFVLNWARQCLISHELNISFVRGRVSQSRFIIVTFTYSEKVDWVCYMLRINIHSVSILSYSMLKPFPACIELLPWNTTSRSTVCYKGYTYTANGKPCKRTHL